MGLQMHVGQSEGFDGHTTAPPYANYHVSHPMHRTGCFAVHPFFGPEHCPPREPVTLAWRTVPDALQVYENVGAVYKAVNERLRSSASSSSSRTGGFFFGEKPCSLDAVLYAHLLYQQAAPVSAPELRSQVPLSEAHEPNNPACVPPPPSLSCLAAMRCYNH